MKVRCVKDTGDSIFKIGDICDCVKINTGRNIYRVSNKKGRFFCSYEKLKKGDLFKILKK